MKTKIFLMGTLLILLTGCSPQRIIVDEMTLTDQSQFGRFKTESITISTKESVRVCYKYPGGRNIIKEKILNREPVSDYQFTRDSLFINDEIFHSIIALKALNQINFKGMWDNEIGFVSEKEINSHYAPGFSKAGGAFLGGLAGGALGILTGRFVGTVTGTKIKLFGGSEADGHSIRTGMIVGGLLGAIIGSVLGIDLLSSDPKTMEQIIKEIRETRQ